MQTALIGRVARTIVSLNGREAVAVKFFLADVPHELEALRSLPPKAPGVDEEADGVQKMTNEHDVTLAGNLAFISALLEHKIFFDSAEQEPWKANGLSVNVVLGGVKEGSDTEPLTPEQAAALEKLFEKTWQYGHVWDHADLKLVSIVLIGPRKRLPDCTELAITKDGLVLTKEKPVQIEGQIVARNPRPQAHRRNNDGSERDRQSEVKRLARQFKR